jgi:glycolate oxidase iron-sulfur subunit
MVKDYGHVLRDDAQYAEKAARVSALTKDLCEILNGEDLGTLGRDEASPTKVAFHPPCTLQHGQKLQDVAERILRGVGFTLTPIPDAHLCCGSAGTYSILQKDLSERFLKNKLTSIHGGNPDVIATANIGCLLHLQQGAAVPVKHWIELLDRPVQ